MRKRTSSDAAAAGAGARVGGEAKARAKLQTKHTRRQAKLVPYPVPMSQDGERRLMQSSSFCGAPQLVPRLIPPPPKLTSNSITFTLPPAQGELLYSFSISFQPSERIIMCGLVNGTILSFAINSTRFVNAILPIDVTYTMNNGENIVRFCTSEMSSSVFVELQLQRAGNIDELAKQIIMNRRAACGRRLEGPASCICPISRQKIKDAGRGDSCLHAQAFDIKSYLEMATTTSNWACPICGKIAAFNQIYYDPYYMKDVPVAPSRSQTIFTDIGDELSSDKATVGPEASEPLFDERSF